jgi:hypothetical protein
MIELDPDAKELIGRARDGEGPSEAERSRLRAAVTARIGAGVVLASAGATSAAGNASAAIGTAATLAAKVLAASVLVCGLGAAGYVALSSPRPPPARDSRESGPVAIEHAPPVSREDRPRPPASASPSPPSSPPPPAAPEAAPRAVALSPLEAETRALGGALTDLREGRAASALSALDAQRARFPDGALREERAEARIKALCALGRTEEARDNAARFFVEYPRSLLAGRVRASCGGGPDANAANGANQPL